MTLWLGGWGGGPGQTRRSAPTVVWGLRLGLGGNMTLWLGGWGRIRQTSFGTRNRIVGWDFRPFGCAQGDMIYGLGVAAAGLGRHAGLPIPWFGGFGWARGDMVGARGIGQTSFGTRIRTVGWDFRPFGCAQGDMVYGLGDGAVGQGRHAGLPIPWFGGFGRARGAWIGARGIGQTSFGTRNRTVGWDFRPFGCAQGDMTNGFGGWGSGQGRHAGLPLRGVGGFGWDRGA